MRESGTTWGHGGRRERWERGRETNLQYVSGSARKSAHLFIDEIEIVSYGVSPFPQTLAYHIPQWSGEREMVKRR